jgi:hypothetical protein
MRLLLPRSASLALLVACPLACAQPADTGVSLMLKYESTGTSQAPDSAAGGGCIVRLEPVQDQRQNKLTLGALSGGPLLAGEAGQWLAAGLLRLGEHGYVVRTAEGAAVPVEGVVVRAALTRLYFWSVSHKQYSMVAIKASFSDRNGLLQEKHYRSYGDHPVAGDIPEQLVEALNRDLDHLRLAMATDLASLCKGVRVQPHTFVRSPPGPAKTTYK